MFNPFAVFLMLGNVGASLWDASRGRWIGAAYWLLNAGAVALAGALARQGAK